MPSLLMAVSQEALTILLPFYVLSLGATAAFAAWIVFLRGIGILLFDVPAGMLVARFGDKPVLIGGLALLLVGLLTLGVTANPWALGVAAVALGSGTRPGCSAVSPISPTFAPGTSSAARSPRWQASSAAVR